MHYKRQKELECLSGVLEGCYIHYFVIKVNFLVSQGRRGNMRRYSHHKVKLGFVFVERSPFGSLFDMAFSCI